MTIELKVLKAIEDKGVKFLVAVPSESGTPDRLFSAEDISLFLNDDEALFAKHHGISREQYRDWSDSEYSVTCSGTTKRRLPCKNLVPGGYRVSPETWVALQGQYCDLHEGERTPTR
jgi:hypothetical protein